MQIKRLLVETRSFSRQITQLIQARSLLQSDYDALKKGLAEAPEKAPMLPGTGGVRKIRLKSASKGKSGGFRVCYYYYVAAETIYLLFIFQKNEQENLSNAEKKELRTLTEELKRKK